MEPRTLSVGLLTLLLLVSPALVAADAADVAIVETSYSGPGVVESHDDGVRLWQSEPHTLNVTLSDANASTRVEVCVGVASDANESERTLNCQDASTADGEMTVSVPVEEWPANATGDRTVVVTVRDNPSHFRDSSRLDRRTIPVEVVEKDGDRDSDRLTNGREVELGTNMSKADTDGDGLRDGEEVHEYETSPTDVDTDGDGLRDGEEINRGTDPTESDFDGDGLSDSVEVNEYGSDPTERDTDGDGLTDDDEVNQYGTDPTDPDTDGDGLGDHEEVDQYGSDPTESDTDSDGLADSVEVNEYGTDPTESDTDGDDLADDEEVGQYGTDPTDPDTDGDLVRDGVEVTFLAAPNSAATPLAYAVAVLGCAVAALRFGGLGDPESADRLERRGSVAGAGSGESAGSESSDGAGSTPTGSGPTGPADADGTPVPTLMADETRVLRMLDEHDGRLPQREIVERTDWSKSKVSRLLSRMEDEDKIKKITLGRENLIAHPSDQPIETEREWPDD